MQSEALCIHIEGIRQAKQGHVEVEDICWARFIEIRKRQARLIRAEKYAEQALIRIAKIGAKGSMEFETHAKTKPHGRLEIWQERPYKRRNKNMQGAVK